MLVIRLAKVGKKNGPSYRIVVTNKRSGRDENGVDNLGYYNPKQKTGLKVSKEKMEKWVKDGAKLSPAVAKLVEGKYKYNRYAGSRTQAKE